MEILTKRQRRKHRHRRIRAKISGREEMPRLFVFRSSKHIYAQLIDDEKAKTLAAASDLEIKAKKSKGGKVAIAYEVGKLISKKALKKKIEKVVFDRGGHKYHGRVKALAEGARAGGLKF